MPEHLKLLARLLVSLLSESRNLVLESSSAVVLLVQQYVTFLSLKCQTAATEAKQPTGGHQFVWRL